MDEHDLEEQLKRIREMTDRMMRVQNRAAELSEEFERDRANARHGTLQEVRDLRPYSSFRTHDRNRHATDDGARHSLRSAARRRPK